MIEQPPSPEPPKTSQSGIIYEINFATDTRPSPSKKDEVTLANLAEQKNLRLKDGALAMNGLYFEEPAATVAVMQISKLKLLDMTLVMRCKLEKEGQVFGLGGPDTITSASPSAASLLSAVPTCSRTASP